MVDAVGARHLDRLVGRAVVDHQPLDASKPSTARGRSASVAGSCSASFQQGIWMISFIVPQICLDPWGSPQYPKAPPAESYARWMSLGGAARPCTERPGHGQRHAQQAAAGLDRCSGCARWTPRRGRRSLRGCSARWRCSGTSRSRPTRRTTPSTRCSGVATCCTCTCPTSRVYRGPTEHPLAIAFGDAVLDLRSGRRAVDGARLDRLVRGARGGRVPARRGCASGRSSGCSRRC